MEGDRDRLPPFDTSGPPSQVALRWTKWVRAFDYYLTGKDITNKKRSKALLLHFAGLEVQDLFEDLSDPDDSLPPDQRTQNDNEFLKCKRTLQAHFGAPANPTYERHVFRQLTRRQGESTVQYCTKLRQQARLCSFENEGQTAEAIRDQIVATVDSSELKKKLLSEPALTLPRALEMCRIWEDAQSQSEGMSSNTSTSSGTGYTGSSSMLVNAVHHRDQSHRQAGRGGFVQSSRGQSRKCGGCGDQWHEKRESCPAWGKSCRKCRKPNHFAKVCRSQQSSTGGSVHMVGQSQEVHGTSPVDPALAPSYSASAGTGASVASGPTTASPYSSGLDEYYSLYRTQSDKDRVDPCCCTLQLCKQPVVFEIDTGAAVTVMSENEFHRLASKVNLSLDTSDLPKLRTYSGGILNVVGRFSASATHASRKSAELSIVVVQGNGPNLLGQDALQLLRLNWNFVFNVSREHSILSEFPQLFQRSMGTWKHGKVKLSVADSARPRFLKARSVPYALQAAVEKELSRLEEAGIISPVQYSEWAAPIVPVLKRNGSIRICGDYKCTINQSARVDKYPLPNIDDLYQKLSQGAFFSKLDLKHAYQQLLLDDESKLLTTINTSKGLFVYNRLPFGVSAAPAIFQRTMEQLLAGLSFVVVYLDDIVVSGKTRAEHDENLRLVLDRLASAGLRLNREKCLVAQQSIEFLGHVIDSVGIRPSAEKVDDLVKAPQPKNVPELRSFLGLINYYHKFIENLSSVLAPLYELLSSKSWCWSDSHQKAFDTGKSLLLSEPIRIHYDPSLPIVVSCDASPYGVGAVLSHVLPDGSDRPVAFASRTLSSCEKNYSQLDREALAMVFGVSKFHKYIFGRNFTLQTDHKPLLGLFDPDRPIPVQSSGRIQRWALKLANYEFVLEYKPGKQNGCADGLSRLPNPALVPEPPQPAEAVLSLSVLNTTPVTSASVARWTSKDPSLALVYKFVSEGWPQDIPEGLEPYSRRRSELSVLNNCILIGSRVVIPSPGRAPLLDELHAGHPGIARMKALARSYVWWPSLDAEIEQTVRGCMQCQTVTKSPHRQQVHPWEWPGKPWLRVHVDFAGPIAGKMLFIIVDSHSKFIEAHVCSGSSAAVAIRKLEQTFALLGLPYNIVSDNGPAFASSEFREFCSSNGIRHTLVSPYHPSSNGLAERAVQTVKSGLAKMSGPDLETRLARFLFQYRMTPQSTTGRSPFELLWKEHRPRSRLDLVFPDSGKKVLDKQCTAHDRGGANVYQFYCGDAVWAMNFNSSQKWIAGTVEEQLGPLTFTVRLVDNRVWKRHSDHLKKRLPAESVQDASTATSAPQLPYSRALPSTTALPSSTALPSVPPNESMSLPDSIVHDEIRENADLSVLESTPNQSSGSSPVVSMRSSARSVKAPVRLDL
ncbi:uncharacterized protein K02A2.6-like [Sycon ciliatum]|uniref:uncharacterized protein K02A2.6-like n=1 Tax=Sycon ciliatum TaxID=27933 RepID=UPI0031F6C68F